jgi:hypothetical protein
MLSLLFWLLLWLLLWLLFELLLNGMDRFLKLRDTEMEMVFVLRPEGATDLSPGFQPWESCTKSDAP